MIIIIIIVLDCRKDEGILEEIQQRAPTLDIRPNFEKYRFTNVYRCLDRVSQYLLRQVIYNGKQYEPEDMFSGYWCLSTLISAKRGTY